MIILASCSQTYSSIIEEEALAITVNIKDMTISFIGLDSGEKLNEWRMKKPYSGGVILPDGDTLLLYGSELETVDLFSLEKGKEIGFWPVSKGVVTGNLLSNQKEIVFADQELDAVRFFSVDGNET